MLVAGTGRGTRLNAIEAMRGVAACMVMIGHILDDATQFGFSGVAVPAAWPIWNAGVDLFFVISGFIMVWTFGDRFGSRGAVWDFVVRRLSRIAPLYWLITVLTAVLVVVWPGLFDRAQFAWSHLILSILFVPHLSPRGELLPIVGVGWTLNYEMMFYMIFAIGLLFRTGIGLVVISVAMVGAYVAVRILGSDNHPLGQFVANSVLLDFLVGVGLGQVVRQFGLKRTVLLVTAAAALLAALILPGSFGTMRFVKAGLPALAILSVALALYPTPTGRLGRWALLLGAASYALYLAHTLVINVIKAAMKDVALAFDLVPVLAFGLYAGLALVLSIVAALLLQKYVEVPMLRTCRRLGSSAPASALPSALPAVRLRRG